MINSELLTLAHFLNNKLLWLYFIIVIIIFYAIISLLTWSIKKPLIFLGIPSIIVGILVIILRFFINLFLPNKSLLSIFNSASKPLLLIGIICFVTGIFMVIIYNILNKRLKNNTTENNI